MKKITEAEIESVKNAKITYLVVHCIALAVIVILTASVIFTAIKKGLIRDHKGKFILAALIGLIFFASLLSIILTVVDTMGSSRKDLDDKLDSIDPTKTSYQIIKNIDNDKKYFVSEVGKAEFDKLSIYDMRNKKVYYESGYKLTKGETESDLTKYLGGKAAHEDLINKIEGVIESYKRMFLLTTLAVVAAIILAYILACLIKVQKQIQPVNNINNTIRTHSRLDSSGVIVDSLHLFDNASFLLKN